MALLATSPAGDDLSRRLERASSELRAAVIAADHAGAERAVTQYVEALRQLWDALKEPERSASAVPARARELLAWARQMTIIQRTLTADQLTILYKASRYHPAATLQASLQVQG